MKTTLTLILVLISSNINPIRSMSHFRPQHRLEAWCSLAQVRADPNNLVNPPIEEVEGHRKSIWMATEELQLSHRKLRKSRLSQSEMIHSCRILMKSSRSLSVCWRAICFVRARGGFYWVKWIWFRFTWIQGSILSLCIRSF